MSSAPYSYGIKDRIDLPTDDLVGLWYAEDIVNNVLPDSSGYGNDGVAHTTGLSKNTGVPTRNSIFGRVMYFGPAGEKGCFDLDDPAELNMGSSQDFSVVALVRYHNANSQGGIIGCKANGGVSAKGYALHMSSAGAAQVYFSDGTTQVVETANTTADDGLWHLVGFSADRDGNLQHFCDNDASAGASIAAVGDIDDSGYDFAIGAWHDVATNTLDNADVAFVAVYHRTMTATEFQAIYKKVASAIQYQTNYGVAETVSDKTAGRLGEYGGMSDFEVISGTWKITNDAIDNKFLDNNLIADPGMEGTVTDNWTASGGATIGSSTVEHSGVYAMYVRDTGGGDVWGEWNGSLVIGEKYRFQGWTKVQSSDATARVKCGATVVWAGTSSESYVEFDFEFIADATTLRLETFNGGGTYRSYWDDVQLSTLDKRHKVMECVTAGAVAIPISAVGKMSTREAAYGTWDFWFYKDDSTFQEIVFIADEFARRSDSSQDGYCIRFRDDESLYMQTVTSGSLGTNWGSSAAAYDVRTWYNGYITRDLNGEFTGYIREWGNDLALMGAAVGTNPATSVAHLNGGYFLLEFAAGDRFFLGGPDGECGLIKSTGVAVP